MPKFFLSRVLPLLILSGVAFAQSASEFNSLGVEAYDAGRFEDAVSLFENAYQRKTDSDTVIKNLVNARMAAAQARAKAGDYPVSVRHLERAIALAPDNPAPLVQLGAYYLQMNQVSDAIFRLEEAIEMKPGNIDAHELLGEAYYRDNDLPSARVQWDYVLDVEPARPGLQERYEKAFREESVEQNFHRGGSRHFQLTYPTEQRYVSLRGNVLRHLERAYMDVGRKLGRVFPPPPIQVIVYSAEQFTEATQLDAHVGAVYDGKIRTPLTDANGKFLTDEELERRLVHEYVHVVVRHIAREKAPWWVNEGLAEYMSRPLNETDARLLRRALHDGTAFSLSELEGLQLMRLDPKALRIAYAQSHAAVKQLWDRYGQRRFNLFLHDLADGMDAGQALYKHYRLRYPDLDQAVARSVS